MSKYVLVGTGGRSIMYQDALAGPFKAQSELAAICDKNEGRLNWTRRRLEEKGVFVSTYRSEEFARMLLEQSPETVIVCTMDSTHDEYICRSLEAGCDVITEKPMTIDAARCQRIIDAVQKTGRRVRVTFNYRYSPPRSQVKELLMKGAIGQVLSVEFKWMLDTSHGADYFRRWHRNKANSGGLLVHKAAHHFDLVNWWLSDAPMSVFCKGRTRFYTDLQARKYGLQGHGSRCLDCPVKDRCNFSLDMTAFEDMKALYLDCEQYDGYIRDKCVFSNEIDIEDTMDVIVQYRGGGLLSYSLTAFSPWEGYHVVFNGTKGRLEHFCQESSYVSGDGKVQGQLQPDDTWIRIYPHFQTPYEVEIHHGEGAHGGGDWVMLHDIFGVPEPDPLLRATDYVQGAYAVLVGIAANRSMAEQRNVCIEELVTGLPNPVFPAMPGDDEVIEFVKGAKRTCGGVETEANLPTSLSAPQ